METQRLRSEVTSMFTVVVSRTLQSSDKGIFRDAITEAVQSPKLLDIIIKHFHSSYVVTKTIARFVARRVDIAMDRVVQYMAIIYKDEMSNDARNTHKIWNN